MASGPLHPPRSVHSGHSGCGHGRFRMMTGRIEGFFLGRNPMREAAIARHEGGQRRSLECDPDGHAEPEVPAKKLHGSRSAYRRTASAAIRMLARGSGFEPATGCHRNFTGFYDTTRRKSRTNTGGLTMSIVRRTCAVLAGLTVACLAVDGAAAAPQATPTPDLTGTWVFSRDLSDRPGQGADRDGGGGGGRRPGGGGMGRPGGGMGDGRRTRRRVGRWRRHAGSRGDGTHARRDAGRCTRPRTPDHRQGRPRARRHRRRRRRHPVGPGRQQGTGAVNGDHVRVGDEVGRREAEGRAQVQGRLEARRDLQCVGRSPPPDGGRPHRRRPDGRRRPHHESRVRAPRGGRRQVDGHPSLVASPLVRWAASPLGH